MKSHPGLAVHRFQKSQESLSAELEFTKAFPLFAGHFEGEPVLPGVSIIDFSVRMLCGGQSRPDITVNKCRFAQVVRPEERLTVTGNWNPSLGSWKIQWVRSTDQKLVAKIDVAV